MRRSLLAAALIAISSPVAAFSLLTWNVEEGTVERVGRKAPDIQRLSASIRSLNNGQLPDVVVLEEVTSYASAVEVARQLGFTTATIAVSDSGDDRETWPFALEVAVITTQPIVSVTSYQSKTNPKYPPWVVTLPAMTITPGTLVQTVVPAEVALPADESIPRAILRVELQNGMVVYAVHFNSSGLGFCRIDEEMKNARSLVKKAKDLGLAADAQALEQTLGKITQSMGSAQNPGIDATRDEALRRTRSREAAAAAVAKLAAVDLAAGKSIAVAGDFNVPLVEPCKTGTKLEEDFAPMMGCRTKIDATSCGTTDGFDDTYALLTNGLLGGARLRVLTSQIGRTYANPSFADSPIDNVFVAGPLDAKTFDATKILDPNSDKAPYGSDHYPVFVREK